MGDKIKLLQEIIDKSNNIVFFDGAGTSTDSGIKDFRGKNGLYKEKTKYNPEYLLSANCFYNNTSLFYDYYKSNFNVLDKKPNIIHKYLTTLESKNKLKAIITQNIDGLHKLSGSKNVIEIHGSILTNHCIKCNKKYNAKYIFDSKDIPKCTCGGIIKPDVVLYGEQLNDYEKAMYYIYKCDTLLVAGTSLTVEPASSLVRLTDNKNLVIINDTKTPYDSYATLVINDNLSNVFSKLK